MLARLVPVAAVVATLLAVAAPADAARPTLSVGKADLTRCADDRAYFCGSLSRALDPAKPKGKRIRIAFRWRPATQGGTRVGPPIVAVEGGPGYPSTGSFAEFEGIMGPLLARRDLLLVDNRGTGGSALIRCPEVQRYAGPTSGERYAAAAGACARRIDRRFGRGASSRFGTADAVDDLRAVLRRMQLPPVALYGDSYGSWFAQAFAARHPDALDSVVLDSTYPVVGLDPFYASSAAVIRDAFDAVCLRDAGCVAATGDGLPSRDPAAAPRGVAAPTATGRLAALLTRLRAAPLTGATRDADGSRLRVRVTPTTLVDLMQWAGSDPVIYRELDPAVRAALIGDAVPLLRLAGQATSWNASATPPSYFSDGAYLAVACTDYPQLFDPAASRAGRRTQLAAAVAGQDPAPFAPFKLEEWLSMDAGSEPFRACLDWPAPRGVRPPVPAGAAPLPGHVPLLVVGGDLDSLTPLRDAEAFAPRLATRSRVVEIANTVHVTSQGGTTLTAGAACARTVIRGFLRDPAGLDTLDASCGAAVPPVHTAGAYPDTLDSAAPAELRAGTDPGERARRATTVAAGALGDAITRRFYRFENGTVPGLRGGDVTTRGNRLIQLRLRRARFTDDTTVSGTARWSPTTGDVSGRLTVTDELGSTTRVVLVWNQRFPAAEARVATATLALPAP